MHRLRDISLPLSPWQSWQPVTVSDSLWQTLAVSGSFWQSMTVCGIYKFYKLIISISLSTEAVKADRTLPIILIAFFQNL